MTSTEIAVRENGHVAERDVVDGWIAVASDVIRVANLISETDFVPEEYRGNAPAVAAAMLTGRELGIGPMMSLRHVQIVKGVPTLSAEYKRARVLAAGHDFEVEELNTQRCKVRGRRTGTSKWLEVTFTIEDARRAKIYKPGGAWETRPRRMLFARAGSELCDFIFADVTNGLPTAELVADGAEGDEFAGYNESPAQAAPSNGHAPAEKPRTARRASARPAASSEVAKPEPAAQTPRSDAGPQPPLPGEEEDPTPGPQPGTGSSPSASAGDEHAAPALVGIIQAHFKRLGIDDREERLPYTAILANVESVASTKDLTPEQASAVADTLSRCKDRERLIALATAAEKSADA